jgi:Tol biopolymer transport system component
LGIKGIRPLAVLDGFMVYLQADGTIMAVRLDAKGGRVMGSPIPVHDPVPVVAANNGNSGVFLSSGGAIVTARGNVQSQLSWLSHDGSSRQTILPGMRSYFQPKLSPDGRRLAILVAENQRTDVWIYDFVTTTFSRLTNSGTITSATWTADGSRLIYAGRGESERTAFWRHSASGASPPEKLKEVGELAPSMALSSDERSLVYQAYHNNTWDLFHARLDSSPVTVSSLVSTSANEYQPQFSPDARWVAFLSDESGRNEVYVRSYPDPTSRVQVSAEGAQEIVWSRDGRLIYFRSGTALMTATVELSPAFRVVRRDTLLTTQLPNGSIFGASYDVARDGRIVTLFSDRNNFELVVSPNWITEFRQRIAASERSRR